MTKYSKLSLSERIHIKALLLQNLNNNQIAIKIGRHRSTIKREMDKWSIYDNVDDYDPILAHPCAVDDKGCIRRFENKLTNNPTLLKFVLKKLKLRWSPQQIRGWLKDIYPNNYHMNISHESIYSYIYTVARDELKKELISYLRYSKKNRKSNVASLKYFINIKGKLSIDYRPKEVDDRIIPGTGKAISLSVKTEKQLSVYCRKNNQIHYCCSSKR